MARRRNLRLPSSSDEDEESPISQTLNPNANPNPIPYPSSPPPSPPLEISDDEIEDVYIDAPDNLSDPSPPILNPNPNPNPDSAPSTDAFQYNPNLNVFDREPNPDVDTIDELLQRSGLRLKREWLESCVRQLERDESGFGRLNTSGKAKLCFEQFLFSDMNSCGAGILPENVSKMHKVELDGPFVLQVDEAVNICLPLRERFHESPAGLKRCLKLSLTDGVQRVFGMEYRPIRELNVLPAGFKIIVRNIHIRRGLLMLVPECLEVLGGLFKELEAARQRLVHELDKPPRGKRKQGALPLSTRALLAAWPSATANNAAIQPNISLPESSNYPQPTAPVATFSAHGRVAEERVTEGLGDPHISGNSASEVTGQCNEERNAEELTIPCERVYIAEPPPCSRAEVLAASSVTSREVVEASIVEGLDDPVIGSNIQSELTAASIEGSSVNSFVAPHFMGSIVEESTPNCGQLVNADIVMQTSTPEADPHALDVEDEVSEVEHPLILSGDKEIPFTYVACLLAKWTTRKDHAPSIQGKIKCTLTGVKGFQFKNRSAYELHVYVDDGSLISEVLIDHQVVQSSIGYSPEEVTAALASSDKQKAIDMKESMKRFQLFLTKFEGTMLLEINENSTFPVALEMNQGCSTSDAWMLLRRLKNFTSTQESPHSNFDAIAISP